MLGRYIRAQERRRATRDTNRVVLPFEWGAEFVSRDADGRDPREAVFAAARRAVAHSEEFYALEPVDDYKLDGELLTWTSAVRSHTPENDTAHARFFPAQPPRAARGKGEGPRRAVVVLPQWNADEQSHVALCRLLSRLGITALRLTLPYHEARRPKGFQRAEYMVSPNVGRTLQALRQAVIDTRAAVRWLGEQGYERIGIMGTSIGSCIGFLAMVHEPLVCTGVFNHVSGYVADVAWRGISTAHVRAGFADSVTLDELRHYWLPISPLAYSDKLKSLAPRPIRFIAARYDLTFPADLSRDAIEGVRRAGHPLDAVWLRCGHYTLGQSPWKYIDGWKIVTFLRKHL